MGKAEVKSKRIGALCEELKSQFKDLDDPRLERKLVDEHRRKKALRSQVFRAIKKQLTDLSD
jgi:hypothetical protein